MTCERCVQATASRAWQRLQYERCGRMQPAGDEIVTPAAACRLSPRRACS